MHNFELIRNCILYGKFKFYCADKFAVKTLVPITIFHFYYYYFLCFYVLKINLVSCVKLFKFFIFSINVLYYLGF